MPVFATLIGTSLRLAFIAPQTANHKVAGEYKPDVWSGGAANVKVAVVRVDRAKGLAEKVGSLKLEGQETAVKIAADSNVFLEAGQELVFVPQYNAMHTASTITLEPLSRTPLALSFGFVFEFFNEGFPIFWRDQPKAAF